MRTQREYLGSVRIQILTREMSQGWDMRAGAKGLMQKLAVTARGITKVNDRAWREVTPRSRMSQ